MKRPILPLTINVLTIVTALVCVVAGGIISYGYLKSSEAALASAHQLLQRIGTSIAERTQNIFDTAVVTVDSYTFLNNLSEKPTIHSHPLSQIFFKFLEHNPDFTSIYVAFNDGDCYIVSLLQNERKKLLQAPEEAVWYTETIGHLPTGRRYALRKFLDADFILVDSEVTTKVVYDPRKRGWFQAATATESAVLSDVYVFAQSNLPGMTISRRFEGRIPGVIGIDISLANLSHFLRKQMIGKNSRVMLFGPSGELYAYPDIDKMVTVVVENGEKKSVTSNVGNFDDPIYASLMSSFWKNNEHPFHNRVIKVQGSPYLALVDALSPIYGKRLFLGIAVPQDVFITPLGTVGAKTLFVSVFLLLLFLPLVYLAARRISRPLKTLSRTVEDLAVLRLDSPIDNTSHIAEIRSLAAGMERMRRQFKVYAAYLPKPVINKLISNDIPPVLGGVRKELSIFYSAVNGFNQLSETMSPEQVANSLSGYFQTINQVLRETGGTIEKYNGDTLTTFWNAPSDDPQHAFHCCLAALRCQTVLKAFNGLRTELGLPELTARIGIHTGQAFVGNIGFSEQMEYTAMGTSCLLAARIQRLNKFLGTRILISETTKHALGEAFQLRFAGRLLSPVPDTTTRVNVYELLGTQPEAQCLLAPFALAPETVERIADWDAAVALFLAKDFSNASNAFSAFMEKHGSDPLVERYLARTLLYVEQPPDENWDGEWFFDAR